MTAPLRVLLHLGIVLAVVASSQAQPRGIPERVRDLEATVATQASQITTLWDLLFALQRSYLAHQLHEWDYTADVDCDAGGSIGAVLNERRAQSAASVHITVSGTCHENVDIIRDHVSILGQPGATIEAASGPTIFVTGQDTSLNQLTIRSAQTALWIRRGHVEGGGLTLVGGVTALMHSTVRLYPPTVIEAAPEQGIDVSEESYFFIAGCDIHDAGMAGVRVMNSTFWANQCTIARSGTTGVLAQHGANVRLDEVSVTGSGQVGVSSELGSAVWITGPFAPSPGSRIAGSSVGLKVWGGSSVRLGNVTIESNGDGVQVGDSSVIDHDVCGEPRITANTVGVRCALAPAVPQLVGIGAGEVFGNVGPNILCPGY